jgi:hypothetical protein
MIMRRHVSQAAFTAMLGNSANALCLLGTIGWFE